MFFANIDKDFNDSEYRKMCYSIDVSTMEDYENEVYDINADKQQEKIKMEGIKDYENNRNE